jgi:hypothetical protein
MHCRQSQPCWCWQCITVSVNKTVPLMATVPLMVALSFNCVSRANDS